MYCEYMKVKVLIIVEVAKCVYGKFIFAHLGNVVGLGFVKFEMAGRTRGGSFRMYSQMSYQVCHRIKSLISLLKYTQELILFQYSLIGWPLLS